MVENRALAITLPDSLVTAYNLGTNVLTLKIVDDGQIAGSKRAIMREFKDANSTMPGRIRRQEWELWGPIGKSFLSTSGALGIDLVQNLETRWDRRLISSIAQTEVTLTGFDPPGSGAYFGQYAFGTLYFSGRATSGAGGQSGICFDEQQGYLFAHRGPVSTQINLSNWTPVAAAVHDADVRWAEHWYSKGRLAMGSTVPMQTRSGVNPTSATYVDTVSTSPAADVFANYVRRGSDRAWIIDASTSGTAFNYAGFTLNGFEDMASPFQVGDPLVGVNGIGPFGPVTSFGSEDGIYSFTDQGKPVPLSKALDSIHSDENGQQFADPGFGWNYYLSVAGLRAHDLRGNDNPVGVGERMRGFTGHNGIPTAIFAARGELWVVYQTSAGALYGYRGVFGPETGGTGQPLFFPWFYQAADTCAAIFSSTTPNLGTQNLSIVRFTGTNMKYLTIAADGRDDLAATVYSTAGGVAYLTTYDENQNMLRTLRAARVRARGLTSGSSWAVAVGFDTSPTNPTGSSYVTVGTITTDGYKTLTPISGGAPIAGISGHTLKPRLTQVAGGSGASSTPPELNGALELEWEERPDQIEEIDVVVNLEGSGLSQNMLWDVLRALVGSQTDGPYKIQLPDDITPGVPLASGGGQKYALVSNVTRRQDIKDEQIEGVSITLNVWPQASAI